LHCKKKKKATSKNPLRTEDSIHHTNKQNSLSPDASSFFLFFGLEAVDSQADSVDSEWQLNWGMIVSLRPKK
jgi:hypothetical protein